MDIYVLFIILSSVKKIKLFSSTEMKIDIDQQKLSMTWFAESGLEDRYTELYIGH